jgi:acylphosphatase
VSGGRRVHCRVHGRVQGVFYRASAQAQAEALGLAGWVRNRRDGTVELVAEGPAGAVDALVRWLGQGPPAARVDAVDVEEDAPVGLAPGFQVRPTA